MKSESNMAEHQETNILLRPDGLELTRAAVDAAGLASAGEMSRVLDIGCGAGQTIEFL